MERVVLVNDKQLWVKLLPPLRCEYDDRRIRVWQMGRDGACYIKYADFTMFMAATVNAMEDAFQHTNERAVYLDDLKATYDKEREFFGSSRKFLSLKSAFVLIKYLIENPFHYTVREIYESEHWDANEIITQFDPSNFIDDDAPVVTQSVVYPTPIRKAMRNRKKKQDDIYVESADDVPIVVLKKFKKKVSPPRTWKEEEPTALPPVVAAFSGPDYVIWNDLLSEFRNVAADMREMMLQAPTKEKEKEEEEDPTRRNDLLSFERTLKQREEYVNNKLREANERMNEYNRLMKVSKK